MCFNRLNDRCRKVIVGNAGLFCLELIFNKTDKSEIFAAQSVPERKVNDVIVVVGFFISNQSFLYSYGLKNLMKLFRN